MHRLWNLREKVSLQSSKQECIQLSLSVYFVHIRCPFEAIAIINLPTNLSSAVTHRYAANAFKLHRLPTPRPGQVLGLVGTNGIGKSTALKILAGKLKPNLGRYDVSTHTQATPFPKFFSLPGSTRLARNLEIFPRIRVAELFHESPGG